MRRCIYCKGTTPSTWIDLADESDDRFHSAGDRVSKQYRWLGSCCSSIAETALSAGARVNDLQVMAVAQEAFSSGNHRAEGAGELHKILDRLGVERAGSVRERLLHLLWETDEGPFLESEEAVQKAADITRQVEADMPF